MSLTHSLKVLKKTIKEFTSDLVNGYSKKSIHLVKTLFFKNFLLGYPYAITIEPINQCNLACEFCSSPPALISRKKKTMSFKEFKHIVDDIQNLTHYLWLFLVGEPYLNPELNKMIAYASQKGLNVTVNTNAMAINKKLIAEMVRSDLDLLIVSLDGTTKESYEKMRKGANFEKVVENIKQIAIEKRKQHKLKPTVRLQMIVSKLNENELKSFRNFSKKLGAEEYAFKSLAIPNWIYSDKKIERIKKDFFPSSGKIRYTEKFELKDETCFFNNKSVILVDGTVCLCCYDINGKYSFGNVFEKPFLKIWNSKRYRTARSLIRNRELSLCKKCAATIEP